MKAFLFSLLIFIIPISSAFAQTNQEAKVAPGEILILPNEPTQPVRKGKYSTLEVLKKNYAASVKSLSERYQMELWIVEPEQVAALIEQINTSGLGLTAMHNFGYALPETERKPFIPSSVKANSQLQSTNDPYYNSQYALPLMDVPEAWNISKGSKDIVVVVMDTGIDKDHPDLVDNIWVNPGEVPNNGIDDDGNGYIDDIHGWDSYRNTGTLQDLDGHGSHVAGIIGAKGNNGIGVSGINQDISIIGLNVFRPDGFSYSSDQIAAFEYVDALLNANHNVVALNQSIGALYESSSMSSIYLAWSRTYSLAHARQNCIWVISAGNDEIDLNDGQYFALPAEHQFPNIITVAASNSSDNLSSFSNYGRRQVEVAAPGSSILSTTPGGNYAYKSGTSMAAPYVTGLIALAASNYPNEDYSARIARIMATGITGNAFTNTTVSGKRINANLALSDNWGNGLYSSASTTLARFKNGENIVSFSLGMVNQTGSSISINSYTFTGADATQFEFLSATPIGSIPSGGAIGFAIQLNRVTGKDTYAANVSLTTTVGVFTLPIEVDTYKEPEAQISLSDYLVDLGDITARSLIGEEFTVINSGTAALEYSLVFELNEDQQGKQKITYQPKTISRPTTTFYTSESVNQIPLLSMPFDFVPSIKALSSAIQNSENIEWIYETGFESGQGSPGSWLSYHSSGTSWQYSYINSQFTGYGVGLTTGNPWSNYLNDTFSRAASPIIDIETQINAGKELSEIRFDYAIELEDGFDFLQVDLVDVNLNVLANIASSNGGLTNDGNMHSLVIPVNQFNITRNFRLRFTLQTDFSIQAGFGAIIDNIKIGVVDNGADLTVYPSTASIEASQNSTINYRINTRNLDASSYTFTSSLSSNATNNIQNLGAGTARYQSTFNHLQVEPPDSVKLSAPSNEASLENNTPTISWLKAANADSFRVQLSTDAFASMVLDSSLTDTSITVAALAFNTSYQWRVKAKNSVSESDWSQSWSFTTRVGDVSAVALLSPKMDSLQAPINPSFVWSADANASSYEIQLTKDAFASTIVSQEVTDTTFTATALEYETAYQWRVRAKNAYSTSEWSTPRTFTTTRANVQAITLNAPSNEATLENNTPTLSWLKEANTDTFRVQLSTDVFATTVLDSSLTDTSITVAALAFNTSYQWRVKAKNSVSESDWSQAWSFTTRVGDVSAITLSEPSNGAVLDFIAPTFSWNSDPNASSYTLEVSTDNFVTNILEETITEITFSSPNLANGITYQWRVKAINEFSESEWSPVFTFEIPVITSISEDLPTETSLQQNYPNPFNPSTQIRFSLAVSSAVVLDVYSIDGTKVASLVNQVLNAGWHTATFNATNLPTGLYLYRLNTGNQQITKKMMLMK